MKRFFEILALATSVALMQMSFTATSQAAPKQGDVLQTDSLSMLLVHRDFTTHKTGSIKDTVNLSGTVGLHYYFVNRVRAGMGFQLTQRLWPDPPPGSSRLQRLALMPQLGWAFADPFFTALIFSYAPRTQGRALPDMAVLAALGASARVSKHMRLSVAVEVPFAFYQHRTLGLVGVTGVSFLF